MLRVLGLSVVGIIAIRPLCEQQKKPKMSQKMENLVTRLQSDFTHQLEALEGPEGSKFLHDRWQRKEGGYGTSMVLQGGRVFEKAGVNVSIIQSPAPKRMLEQMRARKSDKIDIDSKEYDMFVAGISTVVHPHNPMAPTFHANYRYFELKEKGSDNIACSWFGGGADLTPSYLFEEDAVHFHKTIKQACDKHDASYYPRFKKWCDQYFVNTHRGESRGIGGIFFDDLEDPNPEKLFDFVQDCGDAIVKQYIPILKKRIDMPFTEKQKEWQQIRRGRYVEFNLVHDRGTKFGLVTPGVRIESVLMSLPLTARWEYQRHPEKGSWEEKLIQVLKQPREWI